MADAARSFPLGNLWRRPHFSLELVPDLSGRVALVTGGTSGLGLATAEALAAAGCRVFIGCRDPARGRQVADEISARRAGSVEPLFIQLGDPRSISAAVDELHARTDKLHILVNNGGVTAAPSSSLRTSASGVEECFQVNHLGHFELTLRLLQTLIASAEPGAPARVVHLSSSAHRYAPTHGAWLDLEYLNGGSESSMVQRYGMAKLAQLVFSNELHRRLVLRQGPSGELPVLSNAVHPGVVATPLVTGSAIANFGRWFGAILWLLASVRNALFAYDVSTGALTQIYAAVAAELRTGGGYFVPVAQPCRSAHPLAQDEGFGRQLWDFSAAILRRTSPGWGEAMTRLALPAAAAS